MRLRAQLLAGLMVVTSLVVTAPASPAQAACSVTVTTKDNLFGTFTGHVKRSGCKAAGDDTVCVQHEIGYNSWYTTRCHTTGLTNQGTGQLPAGVQRQLRGPLAWLGTHRRRRAR